MRRQTASTCQSAASMAVQSAWTARTSGLVSWTVEMEERMRVEKESMANRL